MSSSIAWRKSGCPAFGASQKADAKVTSPGTGQAIPLPSSGIWKSGKWRAQGFVLLFCSQQKECTLSNLGCCMPINVWFCNCWHFIVTWQRLVAKLEKNYVYLSKKLLFDKWKTKNWTKARKICCEEKYLVVAHKNHPNRWSATWSKIKESSYEYRYPSYLICETRACIPASVWVIGQI